MTCCDKKDTIDNVMCFSPLSQFKYYTKCGSDIPSLLSVNYGADTGFWKFVDILPNGKEKEGD